MGCDYIADCEDVRDIRLRSGPGGGDREAASPFSTARGRVLAFNRERPHPGLRPRSRALVSDRARPCPRLRPSEAMSPSQAREGVPLGGTPSTVP